MTSTPSPTHTRILSLLETIERSEAEARRFRVDKIQPDEAATQAEIGWLRTEGLAVLDPVEGEAGLTFDAQLTPFGRGTLALVRGEA